MAATTTSTSSSGRTSLAIIDTSALVALFDRGHVNHKTAQALTHRHAIWHVSGGVMGEFTTVIRRLALAQGADGNAAARQAHSILEAHESYRPIAEYDPELTARIYRLDSGMSYVDAWGVALAYARNEPLVTIDDRQASALRRIS